MDTDNDYGLKPNPRIEKIIADNMAQFFRSLEDESGFPSHLICNGLLLALYHYTADQSAKDEVHRKWAENYIVRVAQGATWLRRTMATSEEKAKAEIAAERASEGK